MALWVPPAVDRELRESSRQYEAAVQAGRVQDEQIEYWTRELKKVDPRLEMIRARSVVETPGLKPGFFHVMRVNEGAPPTLIPVETPDGEFMPPNSSIFDLLRRNDLWNAEAERDRKRMEREAVEAKERADQREREDRVEEITDRWNAATRASVSMSTDSPWTQSATAKRPA